MGLNQFHLELAKSVPDNKYLEKYVTFMTNSYELPITLNLILILISEPHH